MSTLDNLTAKILADSREKAYKTIAAAEAEATRILAEAEAEAEKEGARILADGTREAERTRERLLLEKKLKLRDENLAAKQATLDAVFQEALERLNGMDESAFHNFLLAQLPKLETDGWELLLPEHFSSIGAGLERCRGDRAISGGFILRKGGVEQNCTFKALLGSLRDELEGQVLRALYE